MLTRDDIRAAALAQPEAYEAPHFDLTSFRVNKKIFCTIHFKTERFVLKLDPEDLHNLADGDPAIQPVSYGRGANPGGWTYVWLEKLDPERLPGLMRMAWAQVAPKRLLK
jgi:predicted DNA-binding protein (MmcQ/YjbR family)